MSEVPVTLPPGASLEATSLASAGAVTAVTRMGMSLVALAMAWAAGVAMARTRSHLSLTNLSAMVWQLACSPWAFWKSILICSPSL